MIKHGALGLSCNDTKPPHVALRNVLACSFSLSMMVTAALKADGKNSVSREVVTRVISPINAWQRVEEHTFRLVASGRAGKKGARDVSFNNYISEDNVLVNYSIERYRSAESARLEMENMISHANKIVERGLKHAPDGRPLGERAVLISNCSLTAKLNQVIVVWQDGADLAVLCSQSSGYVLSFEKQVYARPTENRTDE